MGNKLFYIFSLGIVFYFATLQKASALQMKLPSSGAGAGGGGAGLKGYIASLYSAGLAIGTIMAVGMIVFAAVYRAFNAASPDKIKESNDMIISALWGLTLLFGAYVILNTINPVLVQ